MQRNGLADDHAVSAVNGAGGRSRFTLTRVAGLDDYVRRSMGAVVSSSAFTLLPTSEGKTDSDRPMVDSWAVYVCIRALARAAAGVRLVVWDSDSPDAKEVPASDPIVSLLARPNRDMSWSQFAAADMTHRKLCGESLWFLADANGKPVLTVESVAGMRASGRDPLMPTPVQIISVMGSTAREDRDPNGRIYRWSYGGASKRSADFPVESVIQFVDYNPDDPQRGLGDVQVAQRHINTGFQAERYQDGVMRGGGPGAFLINEEGPIERDAQRIEQEQLDARSNDPENARRLKLLYGKWTVEPNPVSPKDMLIIEHLKWARDVIASTLGVPLPIIGVLENATYSNMGEAWRQFWLGVADYLRGVADVINTKFLSRLADPKAAKYRVSFALEEIDALRKDNTDRFKAAVEMAKAGVGLSFNAACEHLGLDIEPSTEGDLILVPQGMIPLDMLLAENDAGAATDPAMQGADFAGTGAVQDSAMNGAQITGLLELLSNYAAGLFTEEGAVAALKVAFPTIDDTEARSLVAGVVQQEPEDTVEPDADESPSEPAKFFATIPPMDPAQRREYARGYEARVLRKGDRKVYRGVLRWMSAYERAALARLRAYAAHGAKARDLTEKSSAAAIDSLLLEQNAKWEKLLREYAGPGIRDVFKLSARDAAAERGSVSIPMTAPKVQEFLARQTIQLSEGVTSTTTKRVRSAILGVLGEPSTIGDLQLAVREKLPELTDALARVFGTKEARSLAIARTESAHAGNGAKFMQYGEDGVEKVQWVTSHDDAVRESHQELDGEVASYGSEFKPGLRYPADENGPASEVINCRCTLIGLKESDPTP